MGHGRNRRRRKRRDRREHDQHARAARHDDIVVDAVVTAAERVRALARFRSLRARGGVPIAFVAFGRILRAGNPAALHERSSAAIIRLLGVDDEKWSLDRAFDELRS